MVMSNNNIDRRNFLKVLSTGTAAASTGLLYGCGGDPKRQGVSQTGSYLGEVPTDKMTYRTNPHTGDKVSLLGYGCMRWPLRQKADGSGEEIDQEAVNALVDYAIAHGVNYFDVAPVYVRGLSEQATGLALSRHSRDKYFIATKLSTHRPVPEWRTLEGSKGLFEQSLKNLRVDYIDYYLMHMLTDIPTWEKLKKIGMQDWIEEKLASGQIRNIGFSYHGNTEMFKQLVDACDWDFCQIQYNYMDEYSQAGVEGLRYANAKGLPVIIMEPLRGGRLVNLLPESAKKLFRTDKEGRTPAELALKWLYNQPEVTCVLSGMNSMEMVEQNLKTASESHVGCLTASDAALIEQVKEEIKKHVKVGCTGCGYCMPCPRGVDIPGTFRCYNAMYSEGKKSGRKDYLQCTAFRKDTASASQCVGCGKCEKHCPQHIEIRKELKCAASELEDVKYKVMKSAIQILKLW